VKPVDLSADVLGGPADQFVIVRWKAEVGEHWIAPLHVHHHDDEAWYVIEGALGFRIGADEVVTRAGDAVIVPHGTPHTFWNATAAPCRYLIAMTREIKAIIDDVHASEDRSRDAVREIFRRHDSDLVD